jgi:hypothetical protein
MSLATPLRVERLCRLAEVSRAGFYRCRHAAPAEDRDLDLRDEIQRIALEWSCHGWRPVKEELRRRGWQVNHKRVRRIMRKDNLLCLRRRKFAVTTDSNHSRPVYPNLAGEMTLTGIDQLWVADITRVRATRLVAEAISLASKPPVLWLNASTPPSTAARSAARWTSYTGEPGGNEPGAPAKWNFSIDVARGSRRSSNRKRPRPARSRCSAPW